MGLLKRFVILAALATGIGGCYVSAHPAHPYYGYGYGYRYGGACGPYRYWNGYRCI
jgi:hypothetical protein